MASFHQIGVWLLSSLGVALLICGAVFAQPGAALAQSQSYNCHDAQGECAIYTVQADCVGGGQCDGIPQCHCLWTANHCYCS
jgi:hypothetical protein